MRMSRRSFVTGACTLAAGLPPLAARAAPDDGASRARSAWTEAPPQAHGFAAGALERVLDAGQAVPALRSLVVVRDGMLVGERYYGGATADDLLQVRSVTKSVASLLVGQAVAQGKLRADLSQTVGELLPELAARAPDAPAATVTLRQILTGTTGLAYDFRVQGRALGAFPDPALYAMGLRHDGKPAGSWSYNDPAVALLSPMLERVQGDGLAALARRDLFAPLGIERFGWERDRRGREFAYRGLSLRTRDLARLAWMVANGGRWQDTQVVPAAWIEESTRPHTPGAWGVAPIGRSNSYGYLWFTGRLHGTPVSWGWGYGAQFALVAPALRLAVATAAVDPPPNNLGAQNDAVMGLVAQVVALAAG